MLQYLFLKLQKKNNLTASRQSDNWITKKDCMKHKQLVLRGKKMFQLKQKLLHTLIENNSTCTLVAAIMPQFKWINKYTWHGIEVKPTSKHINNNTIEQPNLYKI